ncbi:MAG TPA: heavy metal-responsive transcriptional regulator [Vicinamibacterales bacterium]|jgi:DNA-binding transcriptional MerR regulator
MATHAFTIGEAAAQSGVSADTLRYYERRGVLPPPIRTSGGYRLYSDDAVARVRLIKNAVGFGFSLKQLTMFFKACDGGHPPCQKVRQAGADLLEDMDRRLAEMTSARDQMRDILAHWDRTLETTPAGAPARLLTSIPSAGAGRVRALRMRRASPDR